MYRVEIYQTQEQWEHFKSAHNNVLYAQIFLIEEWVDKGYLDSEVKRRNTVHLIPEYIRKTQNRVHMLVLWIEKYELDNILKWSLSLYPKTGWIMIFQKKISVRNSTHISPIYELELELEKEILLRDLKLE